MIDLFNTFVDTIGLSGKRYQFLMKDLYIFPFNGNGIEALDCFNPLDFNFKGFIDDTNEKLGISEFGYPVFSREEIKEKSNSVFLAVPGSPVSFLSRENIINSLKISTTSFATVIHKSATVSPLAKIGVNVLIMAGVVITSNAVIGDHVCILPNTVIHHDVKIENYTLIGSNCCLASETVVHRNCYIGSGSNIINNVEIGPYSLVGLGSNVIKNIPAKVIVAGNPARIIDNKNEI